MNPRNTTSVTGFRVVVWAMGLFMLGNLADVAWRVVRHGSFIKPRIHPTIGEPIVGIVVGAILISAIRAAIAQKRRRRQSVQFVVDRPFLAFFSIGTAMAALMLVVHLIRSQAVTVAENVLQLCMILCLLGLSVRWIIEIEQHLRQQRRRMQKHCPACNYDLRATPERCPECGTETTT